MKAIKLLPESLGALEDKVFIIHTAHEKDYAQYIQNSILYQ